MKIKPKTDFTRNLIHGVAYFREKNRLSVSLMRNQDDLFFTKM